jgi:hypothetical protein
LTGLLTAPYWKNLRRRKESCARMCWQERIVSLTILSDEPLSPSDLAGLKDVDRLGQLAGARGSSGTRRMRQDLSQAFARSPGPRGRAWVVFPSFREAGLLLPLYAMRPRSPAPAQPLSAGTTARKPTEIYRSGGLWDSRATAVRLGGRLLQALWRTTVAPLYMPVRLFNASRGQPSLEAVAPPASAA